MVGEHEYAEFLDGLLAADRVRCTALAARLLDSPAALKDVYVHLFQRALYEVGALWEAQRISVATEHVATAIVEHAMALAYPRLFASPRTGRGAVIGCGANEYHQVGGRMVADVFELHGWDGWFAGANVPDGEFLALIAAKKPDVVGLSLSLETSLPEFVRQVAAVRDAHPGLPLLVGGQAFRNGLPAALAPFGVQHLAGLDELERWIAAA